MAADDRLERADVIDPDGVQQQGSANSPPRCENSEQSKIFSTYFFV